MVTERLRSRVWRRSSLLAGVVMLASTLTAAPAYAQDPVEVAPPPGIGQPRPLYDCQLPPDPLPENWACVDGGLLPPTLPPEVQRQLPPQLAPSDFSVSCNSDGSVCWNVNDDFNVSVYASRIKFFLFATQVGTAEMDIEWQLEGDGTFVNLWRVTPSVTTTSIYFLAGLYNGAEGVNGGGTELNFKLFSSNQSVAGGTQRSCSCASRAVLRDNQNADHNARAEFSLTIAGKSGFWNFYLRSPVAHRDGPPSGQSTIYRFRPADHRSGDSLGGGYIG